MALKQNIIYIYFKGKHSVTSKSQYQYNHGQFLYFADLDLPQAFEVHFSNKDKGYSKPKVGSNKLVEIPDEYYWSGAQMIYAWIYLHSDIDDGETVYEVRIPLIKRAEPTDEQPLPQQESAMERAIAELNTAVEITTENANKTGEDRAQVSDIRDEVVDIKEDIDATAETVEQKAQNAVDASRRSEASAQNAAEFEEGARNYSEEAEQSAQHALESKNTAKQKADIATDASAEALGYRDETRGYRDEALGAKNDIQILKGQIDETATDVGDISDVVYGNARIASQSANSASQSALSASQSANSASQSASQAEQFKDQSEANVTHYPKVIDGYWYVWDATNEEYVNTNVDARGVKGDTGESGVYIGTEEPTDESVDVWIDTDENADDVVTDVKVNGTSIVDNGIANIPIMESNGKLGVCTVIGGQGINISPSTHSLLIAKAGDSAIKEATNGYSPIVPLKQHVSTFYGLAKSAGDTTQQASDNPVGQYTEEAKASIKNMLGVDVKKDDIYDTYVTDTATGTISSFEDGANDIPLQSLVVDIDPVQNLNGYDSPWVAGGGVNKFKFVGNGYVDTRGNIASPTNLVNGYSEYIPVKSGDKIWITGTFTSCVFAFYDSDKGFLSRYTSSSGTASEDGYIRISVNLDNSTSVTAESCVTNQIQLAISATMPTEYYPYENICSISGWTGMQLQKTRANILNSSANPIWDGSNLYTLNQDGSVTQSGSDGRGWIANTFTGLFLKKGQYTLSFTTPNITCNLRTSIDNYTENYRTTKSVLSFTLTEDCTVKWKTSASSYPVTYAVQLEVGTEATAYEPYQGTLIPISWQTEAGTVYGGRLDVLSGKLRGDTAKITVDHVATVNDSYIKSDACNGFLTNNDIYPRVSFVIQPKQYCDKLSFKNVNVFSLEGYQNCFTINQNQIHLNIANSLTGIVYGTDTATTVKEKMNAWLAENPVTLTIPIEPIEIQLEPHEVNSFLGANNIFADTGDTEVEYRADTKLYINKKITEAISVLS